MEESSPSAEAWARVWLDAQQQFLDAWQRLTRPADKWPGTGSTPFTTAGPGLWSQALDQWSQLATSALPQTSQDVATRLANLGKNYLQMGETFWSLFQQAQGTAAAANQWPAALNQMLEQIPEWCTTSNTRADPWSGFAACWGLPLDNWRRISASLSPFPGELEKVLREAGSTKTPGIPRSVEQLLGLPPLGYTREWQEQVQEWTRLSFEYARATQDFAVLLGKVVQRAMNLMTDRLVKIAGEGESLDGLRAIYDIWVDCGEAAYSEVIATPEFPALQAEMVNALMRLKQHEQRMVEEVMTGMNMPTRRELDTSHKRVYELRRDLRYLQESVSESESIDELREELGVLREALESAPRPAPARATKTRKKLRAKGKATPRRKTTKKTGGRSAGRPAQPKSRKE